MMAIDHRWQWADWCEQHRIDPMRIREVKKLAADAFLLARRDSPHVLESGALLLDLVYGAEAFARAAEQQLSRPRPRRDPNAVPSRLSTAQVTRFASA